MSETDDLLAPAAEVTLTNCDREPIHIPGAIQDHGFLIAVTESDLSICQVSRNVEAFLGRSAEQIVGTSLGALLGAEALESVRAVAHSGETVLAGGGLELRTVDGTSAFDVSLHHSGGLLVMEFEPRPPALPIKTEVLAVARPPQVNDARELFQRTAREIRQLTGYDRVMVYRFDRDGHGEVVGEALDDRLHPLLGHHYPASDIPRQARALYLRQIVRMIGDVDGEPTPLVPAENPISGEPLDLGLATLRAVSPIHLQYLRNMGVAATLTISLIRDDALWGMIACHHYASPMVVTPQVRVACRIIGELLSTQLSELETTEFEDELQRLIADGTRIVSGVFDDGDREVALRRAASSLADLYDADGIAICTHHDRITAGAVLDPAPEAEIIERLARRQLLVSDRLGRDMPFIGKDSELSGMLALPLPARLGTHIIWYRDDWARDLDWGGDPNAQLSPDLTSTDAKTLSPRRSFETWRQTVIGQSRPWSDAVIQAATELVEELAARL